MECLALKRQQKIKHVPMDIVPCTSHGFAICKIETSRLTGGLIPANRQSFWSTIRLAKPPAGLARVGSGQRSNADALDLGQADLVPPAVIELGGASA
jgi:hypothetical protein